MPNNLILPKRYENLQTAAEARQADLTQIVRKVPEATERIESLLRQIESSAMGRFEVILGPSGSGKTTFLSTLPRFYSGAHVTPISNKLSLSEVVTELRERGETPIQGQVFVLIDRDNPNLDATDVRGFFEALRQLFRTREGQALVVWPITDESAAELLATTAWAVGSDSIVDMGSRGIYNFSGLPKEDYYDVADVTARSLNAGQSLEAFGIGPEIAQPMLQTSETLSQFFGNLEAKSQELNNAFGDTLRERRVPSIWVLVAGDDTRELNLTVATLTQGTEKRIDIDRMLALLDASDTTTGYLGAWRRRRNEIAFLLRHLDVRLFELTPTVSLSSTRAFGDDTVKEQLQIKHDTSPNASRAIQAARFFQLLAGTTASTAATVRRATTAASNDYKRIQRLASQNDKPLNKALACSLQQALDDVGVAGEVTAERRALDPQSGLQPDIMIELADGRLICIEPTWRTTGSGIEGEITPQQSTMSVGHIQQYLLSKVLDYVNDLGL